MVVLNLLFWGPIPAAALWVASQVQYVTDSVSLGILLGFCFLLAALFLGLAVLKRLDRAPVVVRPPARRHPRGGAPRPGFAAAPPVRAGGLPPPALLLRRP